MVLTFSPGSSFADQAPHSIAGITLTDEIAHHADQVRMESAMPLRDRRYLTEVECRKLNGYKSGTVLFGNCAAPGKIVRIKLKYEFSGKRFYNDLLDRFKDKFGEPDQWQGDPFHAVIAWKWGFRDKNKNRITLVLQHSRDEENKWGNSVKMTNVTLLESERSCYENKRSKSVQDDRSTQKVRLKEKDYQKFIPQ